MRLVDADALKIPSEEIIAKMAVALAPTIDAEPVKHGRWIAHGVSIKDVPTEACSECGEWSYGYNEPYCQKCGAKMTLD